MYLSPIDSMVYPRTGRDADWRLTVELESA